MGTGGAATFSDLWPPCCTSAVLDAGTGTGGPSIGYGSNCCNSSLPYGGPRCAADCDYVQAVTHQAAALKRVAPNTSVWIYTSAFCTAVTFDSMSRIVDDPAYQGFWLDCLGAAPGQCPHGKGGVRDWDFRNASARAYFAREWGARIGAIPVLDGVYADSGDMTGCNVTLTDFLDFICDLVALAASAN